MNRRGRFFSIHRSAAYRRKEFFSYLALVFLAYLAGVFTGRLLGLSSGADPWLGGVFALMATAFIMVLKSRALNVFRIPVALVNLPIYWVSTLVPKRPNLWIFSCRQGEAYAENPKYLFERVLQAHPDINAVWITKSKSVYATLKSRGLPVSMAYSLRGYILGMRAGCLFMSNFRRSNADYNDYAIGPGTLKVQMWHGSPMKRIGSARPNPGELRLMLAMRQLFYKIFPFYNNRASCHKMLAASPLVAETLQSAFNLSQENMWILGYPKNDLWLERARQSDKAEHEPIKVVYMPTWRNDGMGLFTRYEFNPEKLNALFAAHNIHFYIKLHHFTMEDLIREFTTLERFSHIHILRVGDIYESLDEYDMLVTDYSSILFDYLLADRPTLFAPFDYEEYVSFDQGFLADYRDITPGPHAVNWEALGEAIVSTRARDDYAAARRRVCADYNTFRDSQSAERIIAATRETIEVGVNTLQAAYH